VSRRRGINRELKLKEKKGVSLKVRYTEAGEGVSELVKQRWGWMGDKLVGKGVGTRHRRRQPGLSKRNRSLKKMAFFAAIAGGGGGWSTEESLEGGRMRAMLDSQLLTWVCRKKLGES